MRKALCIGINYYACGEHLSCCVNDAVAISNVLSNNTDSFPPTPNFCTDQLLALDERTAKDNVQLAQAIDRLFDSEAEIALLYFAGHGVFTDSEGYLCASNYADKYTGIPMDTIIKAAHRSRAKYKVIILDCCHSGATGVAYFNNAISVLPDNTIIFAGCTKDGFTEELNGHGIFTDIFLEALNGSAADLLGEISPSGIYAYIDRALGGLMQRPVFKASVDSYVCLRKTEPKISRKDLRVICDYFVTPDYYYPLDPTYEEDKHFSLNKEVNKTHECIFRNLRKFTQLGLVYPVGEDYMYWAAIKSKGCKLTTLGKYIWMQIANNMI